MEQPALLTIIRTDTTFRFRLDLPDAPSQGGQDYVVDFTPEIRERLRRVLHSAVQHMQTVAMMDVKRQTMKLGAINDSMLNMGRFLFDALLPPALQDALRRLDTGLIFTTNTPDIPWELLFDGNAKSGHYLCQHLSIGRQVANSRDGALRLSAPDRVARKMGRREAQGLSVLFMVNPTSDRPVAEEEVATLCTTLPESVSRIILYRQQANQLELRMRISADLPQVLHYAGPLPSTTNTGEPVLALGGNLRLDNVAVEQLFQPLPRRPLVFLSYHEDERQARNGTAAMSQLEREESMEKLASNLIAAGAGSVLTTRWPIHTQRTREF
ncbi:MAG TPA: CHAT domain-containing protein, partial [Ktedonobacteraceae bacterium]|nr:CHAT domain-containing protein [Ktedonobacteraceae bacterium]